MEWWEVLGMWTTIINNLNEMHEKNKRGANRQSNNSYKEGNKEFTKVSEFIKKDNVSDYTKMMREKILNGEY